MSIEKIIKSWKFEKSNNYYTDLAMRESSNRAWIENQYGFIGLYQMGTDALKDTGYIDRTSNKWSGKYGIKTRQDFLINFDVQNIAVREYHKIIWEKYLKDYHDYEGQEINGVKLTKSGMIAASHLVGAGALIRLIKSNGKINKDDGNGITCFEYLIGFKNYQVDYSIDEFIKNLNDDLKSSNLVDDVNSDHKLPQMPSANKILNKKLEQLLSNPNELKKYQQESLESAIQGLKEAEKFVPGITKAATESMKEHKDFLQQLIGVKVPNVNSENVNQAKPKAKQAVSQKKEQKEVNEEKAWLDSLLSHSENMMNNFANSPDMQQFLQMLGNNSGLKSEDEK